MALKLFENCLDLIFKLTCDAVGQIGRKKISLLKVLPALYLLLEKPAADDEFKKELHNECQNEIASPWMARARIDLALALLLDKFSDF